MSEKLPKGMVDRLILILGPLSVISTVYVPSGRAGTQKNHLPTHTDTDNHSVSNTTLFQVF